MESDIDMEMMSAKEYSREIKKFDMEQLIDERKKLLSSIEYLEKIGLKKKDNKDIYIIKLEYLQECIKLIQKKSIKSELNNIKEELHEGDIVKLNNKEYTVSILVDKKSGVRKLENTIEIHVTAKNADDYKFVKRVFNRYKKVLK